MLASLKNLGCLQESGFLEADGFLHLSLNLKRQNCLKSEGLSRASLFNWKDNQLLCFADWSKYLHLIFFFFWKIKNVKRKDIQRRASLFFVCVSWLCCYVSMVGERTPKIHQVWCGSNTTAELSFQFKSMCVWTPAAAPIPPGLQESITMYRMPGQDDKIKHPGNCQRSAHI